MAETRMNITRGAQPVVTSTRLPRMVEVAGKAVAPTPAKVGGKVLLMAEKPKADAGKTKRMAAFKKVAAVRAPAKRPEQKLPPAKRTTTKESKGYVRLRLRVTENGVTVLGAKAVEGPLVEGRLQGAFAYEALVGKERVAAGGIPDAGERRSFPDPKGKGELAGHHVTQLRSYEVNVRVPKDRVSVSALPKLEIALYRVKEELPIVRPDRLGTAAIGPQFERELREVGRLKGVRPDKLEKPIADQLKKAFK